MLNKNREVLANIEHVAGKERVELALLLFVRSPGASFVSGLDPAGTRSLRVAASLPYVVRAVGDVLPVTLLVTSASVLLLEEHCHAAPSLCFVAAPRPTIPQYKLKKRRDIKDLVGIVRCPLPSLLSASHVPAVLGVFKCGAGVLRPLL